MPNALRSLPSPAGQEGSPRIAGQALEQILRSPDFDASGRLRDLLCFVGEEALAGRGEDLTQAVIATRVFGRKSDFDPLLDPIVRIQAGRLRRSLERYYQRAGKRDLVRIHLPRGSYLPAFTEADDSKSGAAAAGRPPARGKA